MKKCFGQANDLLTLKGRGLSLRRHNPSFLIATEIKSAQLNSENPVGVVFALTER